jgi:cytosine/adenosine deaminase-related metal-dependent hydrolase
MYNNAESGNYLIRGARVYDHDADVHQPSHMDLLISDGRVARLEKSIPNAEGVDVIEASDKLVIPGFVNAHYHSHDVLAKGLFEEMPFDVWTIHSNPVNYGRRSLAEVRLRTLIGAAEALRNGITTVQDMLTVVPREEGYIDAVLSAYREIGIRVVFSLNVRDRAALDIDPFINSDIRDDLNRQLAGRDQAARHELDFVENQIKRVGKHPYPQLTWALGPSTPQRCSPELLEGIAALSREYALPVLTHVYETRAQAAAARLSEASSLLAILARSGLMNERLGIAHGVWLSPADIAQIAESGARVVHNPVSNLKTKSGAAPIIDLHRAGVEIALGCDNCSCSDTQNLFLAMRLLCMLPAVTDPEPTAISAAYAVKAATLAGAAAVGLAGQVGAIKVGMEADLAILDLTEPSFVPFNSAARQLVFSECGRAVETVFVAGRPVVRGRKLVAIDEAELAREAAEIAPGFRRDAAALAERQGRLVPPILEANRAVWKVPLEYTRYIGRRG